MKTDQDLLKGPINKQLVSLSLPTMFGMMFQAFYDIVDMIWIGMISTKAVAAMTIFSTFMWVIEIFNEIVGASSVSMISQYHGNGDKARTQLTAEQTLIFKFLLSCAGALVMCLTLRPLFGFFSSDPEVIQFGMQYGYIRAVFVPVFFSSYSVNTIFRCSGDAKTPMYLLTIAAVINIVLDPIMMFETVPFIGMKGMGLGMKGAAWATVIAIGFSFLTGFVLLLRGKSTIRIELKNLLRLDREIDRKLFTVGLPSGFTLAFRNIFNIYLMKLISSYGTEAVAIVGIAGRVINFCMMPQFGLATGGGILIGHSLGYGDEGRALEAARKTRNFCEAATAVLAAFIMLFPGQIVSIFMGGAEPDIAGKTLMFLMGPSVMLSAWGTGYYSSFSGSGMMKPIFWATFISQYCVMVPYTLIMKLTGAPVTAIWFAYNLGDFAYTLSLWLVWRKKTWLKNRV